MGILLALRVPPTDAGRTRLPLSRRLRLRSEVSALQLPAYPPLPGLRALFQIDGLFGDPSSESYLRHKSIAWPSASAIYL